jgi:ABC-type glutathione transport system ATPase component
MSSQAGTPAPTDSGVPDDTRPEVLGVTDLKQHFAVSAPWTARLARSGPIEPVKAVDGVSLSLREGETLGLVAASRR